MKKTFFISFSALLAVLLLIVVGCPKPDAKDAPAKEKSNPLTIPANKTFIPDGDYENKGYTSLTFEEGAKLETIGKNAFKGNRITTLKLPKLVKTIQEGAFENNPIEELTLPASLVTVEKNAFKGGNLKEVVLPDGIKTFGEDAFANKEGASKPLPTFKVSSRAVMKQVVSQYSTIDSKGIKVPPPIETADETKLTAEIITDHITKIKGDTTAPTIPNAPTIESKPSVGDTYDAGETITVAVTFGEVVYVTGTPRITLKFDSGNKQATYESGSGNVKLIFTYTVVDGDNDEDGIEIEANALTLNGGTIKDTAGNNANLEHNALGIKTNHKVNTKAPSISGTPTIESTPSAGGDTYNTGETITVAVTFDEVVKVIGVKPQITLKINSGNKPATYDKGLSDAVSSSDKGKKLIFTYKVVDGDNDEDGIEIEENTLTLNGGIIKDAAGNNANLKHNALGVQTAYKVKDTKAPTISGVLAIESTPSAGGGSYKEDEVITVAVTFSEAVYVKGKPQITLKIDSGDKPATYESGSGNVKLLFTYTVDKDDKDENGIEILENALTLPADDATIKDAAGNNANLEHNTLGVQTAHKVDTKAPSISVTPTIESTPSVGDTYNTGEIIKVAVTFDEVVQVTGTPQITLKLDSGNKPATYDKNLSDEVSSPNTGKKLIFTYTISSSDTDKDGIEILENALTLPADDATIKDAAGNNANLEHNALGVQIAHKVDTKAPSISVTPTIESTPSDDNTYKAGEIIKVAVTLDEVVQVTGTPQITLKLDSGNKPATYDKNLSDEVSSPNTGKKLIFTYTISSSDTDKDGIEILENALTLPADDATIKDAAGNNANLEHNALGVQIAHKVDTKAPSISVTPTIESTPSDDNTYKAGEIIKVAVTLDEVVQVTGTPQITLKLDSGNKPATYDKNLSDEVSSPNTGKKLIFIYTVDKDDKDKNGIEIDANALTLPAGATIKDTAGNAVNLEYTALDVQTDHKVYTKWYVHPVAIGGTISRPHGIAVASDGNTLYVSETRDNRIKKITLSDNSASIIASNFNDPQRIAITSDGNTLYVADAGNHRIKKIILSSDEVTTIGEVTTIAGRNHERGWVAITSFKNGAGTDAMFDDPNGIAITSDDNTLYVADSNNDSIRSITLSEDNNVTTIAGKGPTWNYWGSKTSYAGDDNGTGSSARFDSPYAIAVHPKDNNTLYVADKHNNSIRRIIRQVDAGDNVTFVVTTILTGLNAPKGITVAPNGTIYVADTGNHLIKAITPQDDEDNPFSVETIAGDTDDTTIFRDPVEIAVSSDGNTLYVADAGNNRIRKIEYIDE